MEANFRAVGILFVHAMGVCSGLEISISIRRPLKNK